MKLIIDISEEEYKDLMQTGENTINLGELLDLRNSVRNGTPLDTVKAEIADIYCGQYCENPPTADAVREMVLDILDNVGKAESEDKE